MTTAEFIIGYSAADAAERKKEARKILWAVLAALGIHLLIGYSLAVFGGLLYSPFSAIEEDKPVELTFVDLATPAPVAPKEKPLITTNKSRETVEEPTRRDFQSNANSIAASELPARGNGPLPTEDGKNRPWLTFENQEYIPAVEGSRSSQEVTPHASETPLPSPAATPNRETEKLAMLTSTPQPIAQPSAVDKAAQDFQRHQTKAKISGSVSRQGASSVNAVRTPRGRYEKIMWDIVSSRASMYYHSRGDNTAIGSIDVTFIVERSGRVKNLKLVRNTSNEVFANIILQAINDAQLPPIPDDLANTLPRESLEVDAGFDIIPDYIP